MNIFSCKWHIRPYTSNHVKLALNFQEDARTLFEKETSPDLGEGGYAGYLRIDISYGGITGPLTVEYMRRRFSEFREVTEVCDGIEALCIKYDSGFWNTVFSSEFSDKASIRIRAQEGRAGMGYLAHYLPLEDILDILDRPYLNRLLIDRSR